MPVQLAEKPAASVPQEILSHREAFRARRSGFRLVGWTHFFAILALAAGTTLLSAKLVRQPAWWEWASIPAGFFIANFVEWWAHRYPMHHPWKGLFVMYDKHTLEHHKLYTNRAMDAESAEDFDMVLFSPASLVFFLLGFGLPIALLFFGLVSWNAGWIFTAMAIDYYALYECCHLAYHLPKESWAGRLPGMERIRRHHTVHHDLELMSFWNFNVTFPIFDRVFGTHYDAAQRRAVS